MLRTKKKQSEIQIRLPVYVLPSHKKNILIINGKKV
jgi:hypothetical protein